MKPLGHVICLCACAAMSLAAGGAAAKGQRHQQRPPQIQSPLHIAGAPAPRPPSSAESAAYAGPNPTGLQSAFPAGLPPPGAGYREGVPPLQGRPGHGRPDGFPDRGQDGIRDGIQDGVYRGAYSATPAAYGGGGYAAAAPPRLSAGSGHGYAAVDIARSFIQADRNRDGELTRGEAQRLAIAPYSFEEMDRNFDGVISRFEYEDATR
jgi:hypothetical protein